MKNFQNILFSEWLEIQTVRGVIIGRNCLRVAIDHDAFYLDITHGISRMATTIVKLDALTNSVWATAQNNRLLSRRWFGFILITEWGDGFIA